MPLSSQFCPDAGCYFLINHSRNGVMIKDKEAFVQVRYILLQFKDCSSFIRPCPFVRCRHTRFFFPSLQYTLIDQKVPVEPIHVRRGWLEFDNGADVALAAEWTRTGELEKFYAPARS